jgi:hypothetical protein
VGDDETLRDNRYGRPGRTLEAAAGEWCMCVLYVRAVCMGKGKVTFRSRRAADATPRRADTVLRPSSTVPLPLHTRAHTPLINLYLASYRSLRRLGWPASQPASQPCRSAQTDQAKRASLAHPIALLLPALQLREI